MGSHASSSHVEVKKEVQTFSENFPGKNPIDHPCMWPTIAWRKRMSSFHPLKSERLFISMLRHASVHNGADMMTRAKAVHYSADGMRTAWKMWWFQTAVDYCTILPFSAADMPTNNPTVMGCTSDDAGHVVSNVCSASVFTQTVCLCVCMCVCAGREIIVGKST